MDGWDNAVNEVRGSDHDTAQNGQPQVQPAWPRPQMLWRGGARGIQPVPRLGWWLSRPSLLEWNLKTAVLEHKQSSFLGMSPQATPLLSSLPSGLCQPSKMM